MDYMEEVKDLSGDVKLITNEPAFVGPYSIVYHGCLKSSGELVAVKRMNGIRGASVRTIRRKVQREGWAWSLLRHRNVLPFHGYIEDDERFQPYRAFVSPWYQRGDLGQYLQENPSAYLADRLKIWQGVVDGVAYLHGNSPVVIHGDLKPGNILIDDGGSAKICDFGLARVIMEEGTSGLTTTTEHTGTSRYLAYELVMAEAGIPTTSSDIYAAGCIGLEAVFREIPYSHRINGNNLLWHIRSDMPEGRFPASQPTDSLVHSDPIWKLVLRCWSHEPGSRPQARELSAHLEEILTPMDAVTHLGPARLPLTAIQSQAGIQAQTHTPKGDTSPTAFRMGIDTDPSSGQSDPNSSRDQDPETVSFVDHDVHQEVLQGSIGLGQPRPTPNSTSADFPSTQKFADNMSDNIMEIDTNSGRQSAAANASALPPTARTAPIKAMLPELLIRVFEYAALASDKEGVEVPLRLVTISTEWRKIALETPRAWGRVVIEVEDESSARSMIRRARAFLERSMAAPLDVMLDILQWNRSDDRAMLLKTMLELLAPRIGRCTRLVVRTKEEEDSPSILSTLTPHFGPTLTNFSIESRDSVRLEMPQMPFLTRLSLDDVGPRGGWTSSLVSNLKSLLLRYFKPIAFEGFLTALESAKETLEELRIARCSLPFDSNAFLFESNEKRPRFPVLRKLAIVDVSPGDIDVFFESIQAPALADLFLALDSQRFRYFRFMDPETATCLSKCPLRRLEIEDATIEGSELRALLSLLKMVGPSLEEIAIAGGELDARFFHAMEVDPGSLPKLRSFTIRNKGDFTGRELIRIVNARQARQGISPLQIICVDKCRSFEHDVADQLKRMGVKLEIVWY